MDKTSIPKPSGRARFFNHGTIHILLIALLGLLAYSNTFDSPFQWDEGEFIVDNPIVKDLSYFLHPSKAEGLIQSDTFKMRYIGYLTFALNYKLHGLDVTGYHIVNIAIHILNAILLYFLVVLTFKTPFLLKEGIALPAARNDKNIQSLQGYLDRSNLIAFFSALLFVSHPIQTEAVTYVMQRLASLVAFFYLMSFVFYIKWRLSFSVTPACSDLFGTCRESLLKKDSGQAGMTKVNLKSQIFYLLSLTSAVLAMKTKENAFTLPLIITLYEFSFFKGPVKKRIFFLIPILLTMLIIPLSLLGGGELAGLDAKLRVNTDITRLDYLLTEFRVLITYIRLLFLPVGQNLDYDYPIYNSFLNPEVLFSFVSLVAIFALGVYFFYRSRIKNPDFRIMAFGIFWFFIALSVESSIIPIGIVISEYRVYLSSIGFFILTMSVIAFILRKATVRIRIPAFLVLIFMVFILVALTYTRNSMWGSNISLWEDVVKKSPMKALPHIKLSNAYRAINSFGKAEEHLFLALNLEPYNELAYNNLGVIYRSKAYLDKAIEYYEAALKIKPDSAEALNNLGNVYHEKGLLNKAIEYYLAALKSRRDYSEALNNLGNAYYKKGFQEEAIKHLKTAIAVKPDFADAHYNLGVIYLSIGKVNLAAEEFKEVLNWNPFDTDARLRLNDIKKGVDSTKK